MKNEDWKIEISGEEAKFTKNVPPVPDIIRLTPCKDKFDGKRLANKLRDARIPERYIWQIVDGHRRTFEVPTLQFIYNGERTDAKELMEYIRKFSETVTGRMLPKGELVFDMEFEYNGFIYQFFNVFQTNVDFGDITKEMVEEVVMDFVYDYYRREEKKDEGERDTEKEDS